MTVSANRRILLATLVVASCTFAVKLAAAGKDLALAGVFGVSAALDTFLLAYLIPSVCVNVLAGSLQAAFVPKYVLARSAGGEGAAAAFAASTATLLLLALAGTTLIAVPVVAIVVPLLAHALPAEHVADARWMAMAMTPVIVLSGLMNFWCGYLNAHNKFAFPALTPIVTPACLTIAALLFAARYGVMALVVGTLLGSAIELGIVLTGTRAIMRRLPFTRPRFTEMHRAMASQFATAAVGNVVMAATMIVDQTFAASLGAGAVSTLSFGTKLTQVAAGIFTMAIAAAVLPTAARLVADRDWPGLRHTLRSYTGLVFAVTVPMTAVLVFFSEDIISLVLERGAFGSADTAAVAFVQSLSALQIPFFAWSILIVRVLAAMSANEVLLAGAVISLVLDVVLNYSLVPVLGVAGTGLATSLMYAGACAFLLWSLYRRLRRLEAGA